VVPDVPALFERPTEEDPDWYFERQVDRWRLAKGHRTDEFVVLDGDPFQPLWYNWAYGFVGWQPLEHLEDFYRPHVARGDIDFPDFYVFFSASVDTLRARKEGDAGRRRRNFEQHLRFVEPQRRYFEALDDIVPGMVIPITAMPVAQSVERIREAVGQIPPRPPATEILAKLIAWLRAEVA
jgi:hypothetical protein